MSESESKTEYKGARIPLGVAERIDRLVEASDRYDSRSDAARHACLDLLEREGF